MDATEFNKIIARQKALNLEAVGKVDVDQAVLECSYPLSL